MIFSVKRVSIYLFGLTLLGVCVTLIQQTNLGMAPWDAMYRNLYVGIPLEYKYLNPIIALILIPIAYAIQKKKASLWMLFPFIISFYIGFVIDSLLLVIPSVANEHILLNIGYLIAAIIICAIGLNMVVYCAYPLPALDELCYGLGVVLKTTYGKGKLIGEVMAFLLAIGFGFLFSHQDVYFYIGPTTIIFAFLIGPMIDLLKRPITKGLIIYEHHRTIRRQSN